MRLRSLIVAGLAGLAVAADRRELAPGPAPTNNPLKGLVPYASAAESDRARFPHTIEFFYLALGKLISGPDQYDWEPLERELNIIASRGHQATFRLYLEYPNQTGILPKHLVAGGLKVHRYVNTNTQPLPPAEVETPDYSDPNLRACLTQFIAAFGKKYDGDLRIGFLTAGLLGTWGEWHTYPRTDLFASKDVQAEIMDAYEQAFKITPVLLRYPAGDDDDEHAPNATRRFGYHDDSFAWATLDTGREADDWFYLTVLKAAGPAALKKWQTCPIAGEVRPEAWGRVYDPKPRKPIQDIEKCVDETHVSWLMDTGLFQKRTTTPARKARALEIVQRMGYTIRATTVTTDVQPGGKLSVTLDLVNDGVAPFYADWKPEFALLPAGKAPVKTWPGRGTLGRLSPGAVGRTWSDTFELNDLAPGKYVLAVRVPNPLPNGVPVRFANATQDADQPGWLSLGPVTVPGASK